MRKLMCVIGICLMALPAFSDTSSRYEVGTIIEVKAHQAGADAGSDVANYDVSIRVGDTIYVVLYTPPLGTNTIKYAGGRELLVLVGTKTITYNDMLGQSLQVPIQSQRPAAAQHTK